MIRYVSSNLYISAEKGARPQKPLTKLFSDYMSVSACAWLLYRLNTINVNYVINTMPS